MKNVLSQDECISKGLFIRNRPLIGAPIEGTIVDLETIGPIHDERSGTEKYEQVRPYLLGTLTAKGISQIYATSTNAFPSLFEFMATQWIPNFLSNPLYAYNTGFEYGVIWSSTRVFVEGFREIKVDSLGKEAAVKKYKLDAYDDPFPGAGIRCMEEFQRGNIEPCLAHNRACLLKERDLLLLRGYK